MRRHLLVSDILPVPRARLWEVLSAGDRVERWFPFVHETVVHDAGEGGRRSIHMLDGASFEEYITVNDGALWVYQYYAPAPPLPFRHVIGTNRLAPVVGGTLISWSVSYEPLDPSDGAFARDLPARYSAALRLLGALPLA
jgi:uncharacterized protein YndB with AHSA1/START domain